MPHLTSDRRLYLTRDGNRAVEEGDPDAAFLLCNAGGMLLASEADRLGISLDKDGKLRVKAVKKAADKSVKKPADK